MTKRTDTSNTTKHFIHITNSKEATETTVAKVFSP